MIASTRYVCLALLLVASLLVTATETTAGKPVGALSGFATSREWSDASGKFKITGVMVEANETTLKLRKDDGRVVSVPVAKLGSPDQGFITAFLAAESAMPPQKDSAPDPENPFAGGEMTDDLATSGSGTASPAATGSTLDNIPTVKMSDRNSENLTLDFGNAFWEGKSVSAMNLDPVRDRTVTLPMPKPFFAKAHMRIAGADPTAFFSVYQEGRGSREGFGRIGQMNLSTRDASALGQSSDPYKLLAVSKDASLLAIVRIEGFDRGNDIAILKVTGDQAKPIYQFTAGGGSFAEVVWADFLSNDRLITIDRKHNLLVWNLRGKEITHRATVNNQTDSAVVGGNGEILAIPGTGNVAFLDGSSLSQVGVIELENKVKPSIAFAPNGKSIAVYTPFAVEIFSLDDGSRTKRIAVADSFPGRPLHWVGNNLLLDYSLLIDVENERTWWKYDTGRGAKAVYGNSVYVLFPNDKASTLVTASVPHDPAERALKKASQADLLALKSGAPVALSMNLSTIQANERDAIRQAMELKIEENGWELSPSAANKIELNLKQGKNESEEYVESRGFGPPMPFSRFNSGPKTTVNFRPWEHTVKISVGGKEVFSAQKTVGAPGYLPNEKGKSTQQQVSERVKPSPDFFKNVRLPREIVKPEFRNGFGASKFTTNGVQ